MTDYFAVFLYGFSTGMGVVIAQEVWSIIKRWRLHRLPFEITDNIINRIEDNNKGVRKR